MSGYANISPLQFHGSNAVLPAGARIVPGHESNYMMPKSTDGFVFSTESARDAHLFAGNAVAKKGGHSHVYQVRPTGEQEMDPEYWDKEEGDPYQEPAYRSTSPLQVVRELKAKEIRRAPKPKFKHGEGGEPVPI